MGNLGKKALMMNKGEIVKLLVQRSRVDEIRGLTIDVGIDLKDISEELADLCLRGRDAGKICIWLEETFGTTRNVNVEKANCFSPLAGISLHTGFVLKDILEQIRSENGVSVKFLCNDLADRWCCSSFSLGSWRKLDQLSDLVYFEVCLEPP
jgi:hypothetical protein